MSLKTWAVDTAVRAIKTFAQALVSLFGFQAFNVLKGVDWRTDLGIAAGAALVSVLHNVQSLSVPNDATLPAVPAPAPAASQVVPVEPVAPAAPVVPEVVAEVLPSVIGPSS